MKIKAHNLALALFAILPLSTPLQAQNYPVKPIRFVVAYPPGGATDILARVMAQKLTESFGQQVVVENRSGASGMVGAEAVTKAAPDGYTVLISTAAEIAINQHLFSRMSYDPVKDLAPVSYAAHAAVLFSVHPSVPVNSIAQLIALARARPGELTYASVGTGSVHHLAGELLKTITRINIVHIPYKGAGPAVIDMVGGHVSMGFTALPSSLPHARAGKLRPIAVTGSKRGEAAPDIATFVELGFPAIDVVSWFGVLFPARTPADIVAKLSTEVARTVNNPEVKAKLLQQGIEVIGTTPEQFAKFIQSEVARYAKVIKESGAKLD
ncbi:MAG: tripartite tricarboxylate transporter substrate binding protein [Betaproteobacteria bacterium]|nr:tripartite tricarboxylate transporter substrate binding protein [Betaproteobacteria bacterium]